eukprot:9320119-Karenia_brevis.AAC.1
MRYVTQELVGALQDTQVDLGGPNCSLFFCANLLMNETVKTICTKVASFPTMCYPGQMSGGLLFIMLAIAVL